jgi:dethiobiotin synthetase
MAPIGSLLWRSLRVYQVYGANTEVGKTAITTALCRAVRNAYKNETTAYLKPVSTGPHNDADDRCKLLLLFLLCASQLTLRASRSFETSSSSLVLTHVPDISNGILMGSLNQPYTSTI